MENQLLKDPNVKPDKDVLEKTLGKNYKKFTEFEGKINALGFILEWNYYNDGKNWLCKVLFKKKNYCWLSIWNTGFKLTFFFTEKTIKGVYDLDIDDKIMEIAKDIKPVGKFLPVIFLVSNKKRINDGIKILLYKAELK